MLSTFEVNKIKEIKAQLKDSKSCLILTIQNVKQLLTNLKITIGNKMEEVEV